MLNRFGKMVKSICIISAMLLTLIGALVGAPSPVQAGQENTVFTIPWQPFAWRG